MAACMKSRLAVGFALNNDLSHPPVILLAFCFKGERRKRFKLERLK